jgi:hypothetical protein
VPELMACLIAATFEEFTTGVCAMTSSIFCKERAELVSVTWSPDCAADEFASAVSPCLSVTTALLFEPLTGATGSAVENPLILLVTEISPGANVLPLPRYRRGLDEL